MKPTTRHSIIDAHMHLPVDFKNPEEKKNALLGEMKRNSVRKGIVISDSELVSSIGSLEECANLFAELPDIAVVGGISPFINYEQQLQLLERYICKQYIAGIKLFCGHEPIYLNDAILEPVYTLAEKHNVPVLFHSGWDNPGYSSPQLIKQAAKMHSAVKLICCHCCYPDISECFRTLTDYANVYFDISSLADGDANVVRPALEKAIHAMPDRFIFGSDYGCCSQEEHIELVRQLDISDFEKDMLFCQNAEQIYFHQ